MKSIVSDLKLEKNKVFEEKNMVVRELKEEIDKWKLKSESSERELNVRVKEVEGFKKIIEEDGGKAENIKKKILDLE
jgi:hypothetical protein